MGFFIVFTKIINFIYQIYIINLINYYLNYKKTIDSNYKIAYHAPINNKQGAKKIGHESEFISGDGED